jgi:hypothetical protein
MGQTTLTCPGTAHAPPHLVIIRWEPPGLALPWGSVDFKGIWKRKAHSLCQHTSPAPTVPSASSSLSSPGGTGDSPFLNKAILPHPIHVLCLDFSIWSTKTGIFWSQTAPVLVTFGKPARRNWPVRSQYALSANLYFNPSFSVLWYHASPPDASETSTTYSLGGRGPLRWGIHLMLGAHLESRLRQTAPWLAGCNICQLDSWAPASTPRHRVHVCVSWSCPRGWITLKASCLFPYPFLHGAVGDPTPRSLTPHIAGDNKKSPCHLGWASLPSPPSFYSSLLLPLMSVFKITNGRHTAVLQTDNRSFFF